MIRIENVQVFGIESAIRGMRNPMNSWDRSDSFHCSSCHGGLCEYMKPNCIRDCYCFDENDNFRKDNYVIGNSDLKLMQSLIGAGTDHSKFMRMINVTMDITVPLYWLKEFDTYKVGTVANSTSTMHKIHDKEFTLDDFSHEHLEGQYLDHFLETINELNFARNEYLEFKSKKYWWQMIQLLPSSYNYRLTVQLNYQVLRNIYFSRKDHKLDEWRSFCNFIKTSLPYGKELICYTK